MYRYEDPFDERGLLKDGRTARVRMTLKDGRPVCAFERPRVTDSFGRPPGNRPGFLVSDHGRHAKAQAYAAYERNLARAYLSDQDEDDDPPDGPPAGAYPLTAAAEGSACTINGFPGTLQRRGDWLVCVPNNKQSFNGGEPAERQRQRCQAAPRRALRRPRCRGCERVAPQLTRFMPFYERS
jgi:hypothetical protein